MDLEIWKTISGFESHEISNKGRVRSKRSSKKKLSPWFDKDGYLRYSLTSNKVRRNFGIHRLVAENFIANPQKFPLVNHKDGDKKNNSIDNLEWCTIPFNANHAAINGLYSHGESHVCAKLTEEKVLQIRDSYKKGENSLKQLADIYGVNKNSIYQIVKFKSWKHV